MANSLGEQWWKCSSCKTARESGEFLAMGGSIVSGRLLCGSCARYFSAEAVTRAARWLRPALMACIAGTLVFTVIEFGLRGAPKVDNQAARARSSHISDLLAKDAYAEAAQEVKQFENELKIGEKDAHSDSVRLVSEQYERLDQWLAAKYGRLNRTEHDIIHSLLLWFSGTNAFQINAIHLDDKKLALVVERADDTAAIAESVALKNPPVLPSTDEGGLGGAGGRSLSIDVQAQSPIDTDTQALATYVLRRFSAVDDVEITWICASDRRTLQVATRARTETGPTVP